jgi:hypothetical protein
MLELPPKSQVLSEPARTVKLWRVYHGENRYKPQRLSQVIGHVRSLMWGGNKVITIEPILVEVPRRRKRKNHENTR